MCLKNLRKNNLDFMFYTSLKFLSKISSILVIVIIVTVIFPCALIFNHIINQNTNTFSSVSISHSITQQECCTVSSQNHFYLWSNTIFSSINNIKDILLLLFLFGLLTSVFYIKTLNLDLINPKDFYTKNKPEYNLFDYLKLAFANGVLNPKVY